MKEVFKHSFVFTSAPWSWQLMHHNVNMYSGASHQVLNIMTTKAYHFSHNFTNAEPLRTCLLQWGLLLKKIRAFVRLLGCLIYNMDETGMPLHPSPLKVATWKGHRNPSQVLSGVKSQVTVVGCVSTGGQCWPPMMIWDWKTLPVGCLGGPETIYGLSDKGWIDQYVDPYAFFQI